MGSGVSSIHPEEISNMEFKDVKHSLEKMKKGDPIAYEKLEAKYGSIYLVPGIYEQWKDDLKREKIAKAVKSITITNNK